MTETQLEEYHFWLLMATVSFGFAAIDLGIEVAEPYALVGVMCCIGMVWAMYDSSTGGED